MPERRLYQRELGAIPRVDIPDWELLHRLAELFKQYEAESNRTLNRASDNRGTYTSGTLNAFREAVESQEDVPNEIGLSLERGRRDEGDFVRFHV
jgi:hypothetical protein